jgi:hypothetical protein
MRSASLRPAIASVAAAAVFSYASAGHALPRMDTHDGMVGATAGLCLLLTTAVVGVALPRQNEAPAPVSAGMPAPHPQPALPPPDARARPSPQLLQRFRN